MKINYLFWQKASNLLILGNACEGFQIQSLFQIFWGGVVWEIRETDLRSLRKPDRGEKILEIT